jgi:hypothetical protein
MVPCSRIPKLQPLRVRKGALDVARLVEGTASETIADEMRNAGM